MTSTKAVHLQIFGMLVKLKKTKGFSSETGNYGEYHYKSKEMFIDADLDSQKFDETLLHEIGHAVFDRILRQARISPELEEIIVESLAVAISENFSLKLRK